MSGMTGGDITTLTGNAGGLIPSSGSGNFNIVGSGTITVTGAPATHTLTISGGGVSGTTNHAVQVGTAGGGLFSIAVGVTGTVLTGVTGADPAFSASPTVTTMYAGTFDTNVAAAKLQMAGTTITATGSDANVGLTITPKGTGALTLTTGDVSLTSGNLLLSTTTATVGQIKWDNARYIHNGGTQFSFFAGYNSGNTNATNYNNAFGYQALKTVSGLGEYNNAYGSQCLELCSTGSANNSFGWQSLKSLTVGKRNCVFGDAGATSLVSGDNNCLIGYRVASSYTGAESSNILIGSTIAGTLGESNKLRIGNATGTGNGELDAAYICGIYGATCGVTAGVTLTDSVNKLSSLSGTAGQVLQGGAKPVFSTTTYPAVTALGDVLVASANNVVGVVNDVVNAGYVLTANLAGAPTFQALPASGISTLAGDSGTATGVTVTIAGGTNLTSAAAGSTVTVNLDSSITLTGVTATNFYTDVLAAGSGLSGTTWAADGTDANITMTITPKGTGALTLTSGNINLPVSNAGNTSGCIYINGVRYFSANRGGTDVVGLAFGYEAGLGNGTSNFAIGYRALKLDAQPGSGNFACGINALAVINSANGYYNAAMATASMQSMTQGFQNAGCGRATLSNLVYGNNNVAIGDSAGSGYTGNAAVESNNICIGSQVTGTAGEANTIRIGNGTALIHTACYIGGAYGRSNSGTQHIAIIDSNSKLGSTATLPVSLGGTGAATLTDHGILLGSGTGAITPLGEASNGQIPIGSTGNDPVLATITAGTNITVTNAAGSITLASTTVTINDQTDSYPLVAGDAGKFITMTKGSANTLTVPKDATVNFAIGTKVMVYQGGAGTTTLAPEDGTITINSVAGNLDISAQYGVAKLVKIAANVWVAFGDLA